MGQRKTSQDWTEYIISSNTPNSRPCLDWDGPGSPDQFTASQWRGQIWGLNSPGQFEYVYGVSWAPPGAADTHSARPAREVCHRVAAVS